MAPPEMQAASGRRRARLGLPLLAAAVLAAAAAYIVPQGVEAEAQLAVQDDPAAIADRELDRTFDVTLAAREIEAALAARDADLARSFVELAAERNVALDPALTEKVNAAVTEAASVSHGAESFARGLVTGEPEDMAGLAGTAVGDLFVFGDIRDAIREGSRWASGQPHDELVLGLAGVGLAITAGTYATLGAGAPARVGLSVAKAARRTGRLSADLAEWIGRSLRQIVDWPKLRSAVAGATISDPAIAVRAAREAVKVERAGGLMRLARDVGRVQSKAGTQAALDSLRIAQTPRELARAARLADVKGGKTRAILKSIGRGALFLTATAFSLTLWIFGALLAIIGFVMSCKSATERMTQRWIDWSKRRRFRAEQQRYAALTARG